MHPRLSIIVDPLYITTASESNCPLYHPALLGSAGHVIVHREPATRGLAFLPVPFLCLRFTHGQLLAALLSALLQNLTSPLTRPTRQVPVCTLSLSFLRLIRSLRHVLLLRQVRQRARLSAGTLPQVQQTPTESLPRLHLTAWEPSSPADRRQSQNLTRYYTVMGTSGQIPTCREGGPGIWPLLQAR